MKTLSLALAALLLSQLPARAETRGDVELSSLSVQGDSYGDSARRLWDELVAFGVKPVPGASGRGERIEIRRGAVTITNGAACNDGRQSYRVEFSVTGDDEKEIQHVELADEDECRPGGRAERFLDQVNHFGADTVGADCGLGHCYLSVDSISCFHSPAKGPSKESLYCSVTSSSGQKN